MKMFFITVKSQENVFALDEKPSTYYTLSDAKFLSNLQWNVKLCEHDNNRLPKSVGVRHCSTLEGKLNY